MIDAQVGDYLCSLVTSTLMSAVVLEMTGIGITVEFGQTVRFRTNDDIVQVHGYEYLRLELTSSPVTTRRLL